MTPFTSNTHHAGHEGFYVSNAPLIVVTSVPACDFAVPMCKRGRLHYEAFDSLLPPRNDFAIVPGAMAKADKGEHSMRRFLPGKKSCLYALVLLVPFAGLAYWQKAAILSWYYVGQLSRADDANRDACVRRIVEVGERCVPGLLDLLPASSETTRANVAWALNALALDWGPEDARTEMLLEELRRTYARGDMGGKTICLTIVASFLDQQPANQMLPAAIAKSAVELLAQAAPDEALLLSNLRLARGFLERVPPGQGITLCRGLALNGLTRNDPAIRLAAVQVVLQSPLKKDQELLAKLIPLLKDAEAELRQASLLALAGERDLVGDDDLLALLA